MRHRVGEHSYKVEVKPGKLQEAHRSQLRPHVADTYAENPYPMHYFVGKAPAIQVEPDEWIVDSIDDHRIGPTTGKLEFLVKWKDWDPTDRRWEPCPSFFPSYNEQLVEYCAKKGIQLDLTQALATDLAKKGKKHKTA